MNNNDNAKSFGIPYAQANEDGSKTCPICGAIIFGIDESFTTAEDAITKGSGLMYGLHYEKEHENAG